MPSIVLLKEDIFYELGCIVVPDINDASSIDREHSLTEIAAKTMIKVADADNSC